MKNKWPTKKLGAIIELHYGKGIAQHDRKANGKYPIYGANGELGRTDKFLVEGEALIIGRKGSAGEVTRVSGKFWPADVTYYIFDNKQIKIDYLFYVLKLLDLKRLATGIKPGINRNRVYELKIPLPAIGEQRKIVEKIEKLFAKIDEASRLRVESSAASAAILPSALHRIFFRAEKEGWGEKTLPDISKNLDAKRRPIKKSLRKKGEYPYYGASGIVDYVKDYIFDQNLLLISEDGANLVARTTPIAFSVSGKAWVNNHAHILSFADFYTQRFTEFYFNSIDLKPYISGMAQPKLNQDRMNQIKIPLPSLAEQKKIVAYLDALSQKSRELQNLQSQTAADLSALRQSILSQAFGRAL